MWKDVEKRLKHGILDVQDKPAVKSLEEAPNGRGDSERWGPGRLAKGSSADQSSAERK